MHARLRKKDHRRTNYRPDTFLDCFAPDAVDAGWKYPPRPRDRCGTTTTTTTTITTTTTEAHPDFSLLVTASREILAGLSRRGLREHMPELAVLALVASSVASARKQSVDCSGSLTLAASILHGPSPRVTKAPVRPLPVPQRYGTSTVASPLPSTLT
jgi:hypothetical protein